MVNRNTISVRETKWGGIWQSASRLAALVGVVACTSGTAAAQDNAVTFWNETAITTSAVHLGRAAAISPVDLAYVHAAIYDVVVALRGGYRPFAVELHSVPPDASLEAAIAAAAHSVLLTNTDEMIREIIDARVWAGIHYRTSAVHGVVLGRRVARWVAKRYFLPVE